jgi:hypothetical protein
LHFSLNIISSFTVSRATLCSIKFIEHTNLIEHIVARETVEHINFIEHIVARETVEHINFIEHSVARETVKN